MNTERIYTLKISTWKDIFFILLFLLITTNSSHSIKEAKLISPHFQNVYAEETIVPNEKDEITSYIKEVFGKDSDKAFKLLSCENKSLSPDAVNTAGNFPEGSRDIGIFQENEFWQGVQGKFLFNWKINIQIAHQLYTENGNSFKLWSCGRRLSI